MSWVRRRAGAGSARFFGTFGTLDISPLIDTVSGEMLPVPMPLPFDPGCLHPGRPSGRPIHARVPTRDHAPLPA